MEVMPTPRPLQPFLLTGRGKVIRPGSLLMQRHIVKQEEHSATPTYRPMPRREPQLMREDSCPALHNSILLFKMQNILPLVMEAPSLTTIPICIMQKGK